MTLAAAIAAREEAWRKLRVAIGRRYGVGRARRAFQDATTDVLKAERSLRALNRLRLAA